MMSNVNMSPPHCFFRRGRRPLRLHLFTLTILAIRFKPASATQLRCDHVQDDRVCVLTRDQFFDDDFLVEASPSLLNGLAELHVDSRVSCAKELCSIKITDFDVVRVSGTIEGSDITISKAKEVEVTSTGHVHGNELGHRGGSDGGGTSSGGSTCCYNWYGASHGGRGGYSCGDNSALVTYGEADSPSEFGSGGVHRNGLLSGGGRVYISSADRIVVNGLVEENGQDSDMNQASLGSGGSIWLSAPSIVGSGTLRADGGTCTGTQPCGAGGGGRIALRSDDLQGAAALTTSVSGGTASFARCPDQSEADDGSIEISCITETCYNGGQKLQGGQCGCQCIYPWYGIDCQKLCEKDCSNGGILDKLKCVCSCPFGWEGDACDTCSGNDLCSSKGTCDDETQACTCDEDYYTDDCSVKCTVEDCSLNGICDEETGRCACLPGYAGSSCACDVLDCNLSGAAQGENVVSSLCSDNGNCEVDQCVCHPGYYGCDCSTFCSSGITCSGNGACVEKDGTCKCEFGWTGSDCSRQDLELYCLLGDDNAANTATGHPCLPGLHGHLGYGYDLVEGANTIPIAELKYTKQNRFTHNLLGTFEIPDGVTCQELTVDTVSQSSTTYRSFEEYRASLATKMGVGLNRFKKSYFSGSAEARYVQTNAFQQERFYSESVQYYNLYRCSLANLQGMARGSQILEAAENLTPARKAAHAGTHVVDAIELGGYLSASAFISSCVLKSLTVAEVNAEVELSVAQLTTSGSYKSTCDVYNKYATFNSRVGGGDKSLLAFERGTATLKDWLDSLQVSPTVSRRFLQDLGSVLPEMGPYIDEYVEQEPWQPPSEDYDGAQENCPRNLSCDDGLGTASSEGANLELLRIMFLSWLTSFTFSFGFCC